MRSKEKRKSLAKSFSFPNNAMRFVQKTGSKFPDFHYHEITHLSKNANEATIRLEISTRAA